ncbi:MAG: hypothetical protein FWC27_15165 [Firmicutes bacterium]|nr:hypothetical protein [Bacillota bacterium]
MLLTTLSGALLFLAVSAVAVSYGWGMRGTNLGGETGAMLPGALMGLCIAIFSGSPFLREHFYLLSAAGALGMYFGGSMSYGETVGLVSNKNPNGNLAREYTGLFVKGGLWFGLFGAVTGMFLSFLAGLYDLRAVLLTFGLLPVFAFCGSRAFDRPYDEKKGIHPKIYFSRTRPEGMGVLFGILIGLVACMAIYKDSAALWLTLGGTLSGGLGWVIAQWMQIRARHPNRKGKRFCGRLSSKGLLDTWKIMECALGAFAGLGISITFTLIVNFSAKYQSYQFDSIPKLVNLPDWLLPVIFLALLALDMLKHVIKRPRTKEELDWQLGRCLISREEHEIAMRSAGDAPSKAFLRYEKINQVALMPIYCILPLFFLFLGSFEAAKLVSFYVIYYVVAEQNIFDRFNLFKSIWVWRVGMLGGGLALVLAQFFLHWTPNLFLTALMYGAGYEAITLVGSMAKRSPERLGKKTARESSLAQAYGGQVTTHGYSLLCVLAITVFAGLVQYG